MGPLFIGIGLAATSYLFSLPVIADADTSYQITTRLLSWLPFLTTSIAFTLIYILIPNCFVPKKIALAGGVLCAIFFELAKYGFGIYIKSMPTYQNIYGAVSAIPLFLIWIYVSWTIVLFGSHLSFCLTSFRLQDEIENRSKAGWSFVNVLKVLEYLYHAQQSGHTVSIPDFRKKTIKLPHHQLNDLLEYLEHAEWVNQSSNGQWLLSRDMTETTLYELHEVLPVKLPVSAEELDKDILSQRLKDRISEHRNELESVLSVSLSDFLKSKNA